MGTMDFFESDLGKKKEGDIPLRGDSPLLESLEPRLMMSGDPVLDVPRGNDFSHFFNTVDVTPIWDTGDLSKTVSLLGITGGSDITDVKAPSFKELTEVVFGADAVDINGDEQASLSEFLLNGLQNVLKNELSNVNTITDLIDELNAFKDSAKHKIGQINDGKKKVDDYVEYTVSGIGEVVHHTELSSEVSFNFDTEFYKELKIDLGEAGRKVGLALGDIDVDVKTVASLNCSIGLLDVTDFSTAYVRFGGLNFSTDATVGALNDKEIDLGFLGLKIESEVDSNGHDKAFNAGASISSHVDLDDVTFPDELGITHSDFSQSGTSIQMSDTMENTLSSTHTNEFTLNLGGKVTKNVSVKSDTDGATTLAKIKTALSDLGLDDFVTATSNSSKLVLTSKSGNFSSLGLGNAGDFTVGKVFNNVEFEKNAPDQSFDFTLFANNSLQRVSIAQSTTLTGFRDNFNSVFQQFGLEATYTPETSPGSDDAKVTISGTLTDDISILDSLDLSVGSILTATDLANAHVSASVDAGSFTSSTKLNLTLHVADSSRVDLGVDDSMSIEWKNNTLEFKDFGALEQFKNITSDSFKDQLNGVAQWAEQQLVKLFGEKLDVDILQGDLLDVIDFKSLVQKQLIKPLVESDEPMNLQSYVEAFNGLGLTFINYDEALGEINFSFDPFNVTLKDELSFNMDKVVKAGNSAIASVSADPFAAISGVLDGDIQFSLNLDSIAVLDDSDISGKTPEEIQVALKEKIGEVSLSEFTVESKPDFPQFFKSNKYHTVTSGFADRSINLTSEATFELNGVSYSLDTGRYVGVSNLASSLSGALSGYTVEYIESSDSFIIDKTGSDANITLSSMNKAAKSIFGNADLSGAGSITFKNSLSYLDISNVDNEADQTFTLKVGSTDYTVKIKKQRSAVTSFQSLLEIIRKSDATASGTTVRLDSLVDVHSQSDYVNGEAHQRILLRSKTAETAISISDNNESKLGLDGPKSGNTNDLKISVGERSKGSSDDFAEIGSHSISLDDATSVAELINLLDGSVIGSTSINIVYSNERGTFSVNITGGESNKEYSLSISAENGSLIGSLLGIVGTSENGILESERLAGSTSDSLIELKTFELNASYGISTSAEKEIEIATVKPGIITVEDLYEKKGETTSANEVVFQHSRISSRHIGSMLTLKYYDSAKKADITTTGEILYVVGDKAAINIEIAAGTYVWGASVAGKADTETLYEEYRLKGDGSFVSHSTLDQNSIGTLIKVTDKSSQIHWFTVVGFEDGYAILNDRFLPIAEGYKVEYFKGNFELGKASKAGSAGTVLIEIEKLGTTSITTPVLSNAHEGKWITAEQADGTTTYHRIKSVSGGKVTVTGEIAENATITLAGVSANAQIGGVAVSLLATGGVTGDIGFSLGASNFGNTLDRLKAGKGGKQTITNRLTEKTITLALVADGLPFHMEPGSITLTFDTSDSSQLAVNISEFSMPDVEFLKDFNIADVIDFIANNITTILNSTIGDKTVPLIDKKLNELVPVVQDFTDALNTYKDNPAGTLQGLEEALEDAFGLSGYLRDRIGLDVGHIYDKDSSSWKKGLLLNFNNLGFTFNQSKSLSMNIGEKFNLSGSVDADVFGYISANLGMGFTFDGGLKMHLNRDQTFVRSSISMTADNINLGASVGPLGVYIKDYEGNDSNLGMSLSAGVEFEYDYFTESAWASIGDVFSDSSKLHFYAEGLQFYGDLHMYGPTDAIYLGSIKLGLGTAKGTVAYEKAEQKVYTEVTDLGITLVRVVDEDTDATNIGDVEKGDLVVDVTEFDPGGTIKDLIDDFKDFDIFDGMVAGSEALDFLLGSLQERVDEKLGEVDLPIIGDGLSNGAGFIEDFREGFLKDFREVVGTTIGVGQNLEKKEMLEAKAQKFADGMVAKLNELLDGTPIDVNVTGNAADGYAVEWDMVLTGSWGPTLPFDFDLGIPGFGMNGDAELTADITWRIYLGFGIDSNGFYVKLRDHEEEEATNNGGELELDISLALKEAAPDKELFKGSLGFLELSAKGVAGKDAARAAVGIAIDLDQQNSNEVVNFMDLASLDLTPRLKIGATADLALTLGLLSDGGGKFPNIDTTFTLGAGTAAMVKTDAQGKDGFGDATYETFGVAIKSMKNLTFGFNNLTLDFGEYIDGVLGDTLRGIQKYTQPLQPTIDFLVSPFPVLGDLGINLTPLDLAKQFSKGKFDPGMIYAISDIITLINMLPGDGANLGLNFGSVSWSTVNGSLVINDEGLTKPEDLFSTATRTRSSSDLGSFEKLAKDGKTDDMKSEGGWAFPIISDPVNNIVSLLTGGNAVLITYDMPELSFEFDWDKFIRIYGPLGVNIGVNFGVEIDLGFGYDTMGIRNFIASDFKNPLLLTNGFYISDTVNADGTGDETAELVLYGALRAAVALNVGVAEVGVGGGVGIDIGFDLYDPDKDGRVRLYEMAETFLNEWHNGNKLKAPLSIFDVHGEIWAQLYAYVEFLWFRKEFEITPKIVLFQFDIKFERPQVLATVVEGRTDASPYSGSEFQLNVGEFAADRLNGNIEDGNENMEIIVDGDTFTASLNGKTAPQTYRATGSGPKIIYFNGNEGNDTLTVKTKSGGAAGVFQFVASGGVGNDNIDLSGYNYAGNVANELTGDEGNDTIKAAQGVGDVIVGGFGNDTIDGNSGKDIIFGDGGAFNAETNKAAAFFKPDQDGEDTITGGEGKDVIFGGGGSDTLYGDHKTTEINELDPTKHADIVIGDGGAVEINDGDFTGSKVTSTQRDRLKPKGGSDTIFGGKGNDILYGGTGSDKIDGGANDDTIYGQIGNDVLYGGTGSDEVLGSVGDDVIFGERGSFAFDLKDAFMGLPDDIDRELFDGDTTDTTSTAYHDELLDGADGADIIFGDFGAAVNKGGTDVIEGGTGADYIDGTAGNDDIKGGDDDDTIFGGTGNDTIDGEQGSDVIFGDRGHHDFVSTTAGFESPREKEVFGFNDADEFGFRYDSDSDVVSGPETATVSKNFGNGASNNDTIITGVDSDFVDGQVGHDDITMNVQPTTRSSITNVVDTGWESFGSSGGSNLFEYSDRDKLYIVGSEGAEKFLIRASHTGVGLIGVISNNDKTLQRINVWGNNEVALNDDGTNPNKDDAYVGVDEINVEGGKGDDKIALDGTVTQTNVFGGYRDKSTDHTGTKASDNRESGEDTFQIGQLYRSGRGADDADLNKILPDDYFNTTKVSLGYLSDGVNDVTNIYGGDGDDDFTVYRNTEQLNLYGEDGDDNFLVKAFVDETEVEKVKDDEKGIGGFLSGIIQKLQDLIDQLTSMNQSATGLKKFALDLKDVGKVYTEAQQKHSALENAVVNIDGGNGFDTVTIVGTELDDVFYVTEQGIFGAGVKVNYKGIERVVLDAAEGNDKVYVTGTNKEYITEIQGGKGSDSINIGDIDQEKTFKVPQVDANGEWVKNGNQVMMEDYTVTKDNVGRLDKFHGQLIVDGAGGNGAFVQSNPILMPHINVLGNVKKADRIEDEQNERIEHGKLLGINGRTVVVGKQNLKDALLSLWDETVTDTELPDALIDRTIAVTSGTSFVDEFRWIKDVSIDGDLATLTLNERFSDAKVTDTGFAIDDMSLNFFANEVEETDTISVNNTLADGTTPAKNDHEVNPRSKNTTGTLSDLSNANYEFLNRKLGDLDLKHLGGFGMVGEHEMEITEKNKAGEKTTAIKNFPGGIVFGDMEVVEINLSETQVNTLDITATTGRRDGFQTWTVVNGGTGVDKINVSDVNSDEQFITEIIAGMVDLVEVNPEQYDPEKTVIADDFLSFFAKEINEHGEEVGRNIADLIGADISIELDNGLLQKCKIVDFDIVDPDDDNSDLALHLDRIIKGAVKDGNLASITRSILDFGVVDSYTVVDDLSEIVINELPTIADPVGAAIEILDEDGNVLGTKEILSSALLAGGKQKLVLSSILGLDSKVFDVDRIDSFRILRRVSGPLVIQSGEGDDIIDIQNSNIDTVVVAGQGSDTITLGSGNNTVFGDDGVVSLSGTRALRSVPGVNNNAIATTTFGEGYSIDNDGVVRGIDEAQTVGTTGGDDTIVIAGGSNVVFGGMGEDDITIQAGDGDDIAFGDNGKLVYNNIEPEKVVWGDTEQSILRSAESTDADQGASDMLITGEGSDIVIGGAGDDFVNYDRDSNLQIDGDTGNDVIVGDNGRVNFTPTANNNVVESIESIDTVGGNDKIYFGNGDQDIVIGGVGSDTIVGGDDALSSAIPFNEKLDVIIGDNGKAVWNNDNKHIIESVTTKDPSDGGTDIIAAGNGNDIIVGGAGSDIITGGSDVGKDVVLGDNGEITWDITGETSLLKKITTTDPTIGGSDNIQTGDGDDVVIAGIGDDKVNYVEGPLGLLTPSTDTDNGSDVIIGDNGEINYDVFENHSSVSTIESTGVNGGDDHIFFGDGDQDIVIGGYGSDHILGGDAALTEQTPMDDKVDVILGDNGKATWINTEDKHLLSTIASDDSESSLLSAAERENRFNDKIYASNGNDIVIGGEGHDTIEAGEDAGKDVVLGDSGYIRFDTNSDESLVEKIESRPVDYSGEGVYVGGNDTIITGDGDDIVLAGNGDDLVNVRKNADGSLTPVEDDNGDDVILGDNGYVTFDIIANLSIVNTVETIDYLDEWGYRSEQSGDDTIYFGNGDRDIVFGGLGKDYIMGGDDSVAAGSDISKTQDVIFGDNGIAQWVNTEEKHLIKMVASKVHINDDGTSPEDTEANNDVIRAENGNDIVIGGMGSDAIFAGTDEGSDVVLGDNGEAYWNTDLSFSRIEAIRTTETNMGGSDSIWSGDGDDIVLGGAKGDYINADKEGYAPTENGSGDYELDRGDDVMLGDNGEVLFDLFTAGSKVYRVSSNHNLDGGDDIIVTGNGSDIVIAGVGNDIVDARGYDEYINSQEEEGDTVIGDNGTAIWTNDESKHIIRSIESTEENHGGDDQIATGIGHDLIVGGYGSDEMYAGELDGNDIVIGDNGRADWNTDLSFSRLDVIKTTAREIGGDDYIQTGDGDDVVLAGAGNDSVNMKDHEIIDDDNGSDVIVGDNGTADYDLKEDGSVLKTITTDHDLNGGDDEIFSGNGDDFVIGGVGNDYIHAGNDEGDDIIIGDNGIMEWDNDTVPDAHLISRVESQDRTVGGNDEIVTGSGDDITIGGAGSDKVNVSGTDINVTLADAGNDKVLGDNGSVLYEIINNEAMIKKFTSDDDLTGDTDYIATGTGDDMVIAGMGDDEVNLGTTDDGNDKAIGDNGSIIWDNISRMVSNLDQIQSENLTEGGSDHILSGDGDDVVIGGVGSDYINANRDHSEVAPEGTTHGDTGVDVVVGDNGFVDYRISYEGVNYIRTINTSEYDPALDLDSNYSTDGDSDVIYSGNGNDVVIAGVGDDWVDTGEDGAQDFVMGDNGEIHMELVNVPVEPAVVSVEWLLQEMNVVSRSTGGDDNIFTGDGGDKVIAGMGKDAINYNRFTDEAVGDHDTGRDMIIGDNGYIRPELHDSDNPMHEAVTDNMYNGDVDVIHTFGGGDTVLGGEGGDEIYTGEGDDVVIGDSGVVRFTNIITGYGTYENVNHEAVSEVDLSTMESDDTIVTGSGNDVAIGGHGSDTITSDSQAGDTEGTFLSGDGGRVSFTPGLGATVFESRHEFDGKDGNDVIVGGDGNTYVIGGNGNDDVTTGTGDDVLLGDKGQITFNPAGTGELKQINNYNSMTGGDDSLKAGAGKDWVVGGVGSDYIHTGVDNEFDKAYGGNIVAHFDDNGNLSTVTEQLYVPGTDTIVNPKVDIMAYPAFNASIAATYAEGTIVRENGALWELHTAGYWATLSPSSASGYVAWTLVQEA